MVAVFHVKVTGSAEIVVTAGSSSDKRVVPSRFLGRTIGYTVKELSRQGYRLKFVTDKFFVLVKPNPRGERRRLCVEGLTLFV